MCKECSGTSRIFGGDNPVPDLDPWYTSQTYQAGTDNSDPFITPDQAAAILTMPDVPDDNSAYPQNSAQPTPPPPTVTDKYAPQPLYVQWMAYATACESCLANAAVGIVPWGTTFPSGDIEPPAHPQCKCELQNFDQYEADPTIGT